MTALAMLAGCGARPAPPLDTAVSPPDSVPDRPMSPPGELLEHVVVPRIRGPLNVSDADVTMLGEPGAGLWRGLFLSNACQLDADPEAEFVAYDARYVLDDPEGWRNRRGVVLHPEDPSFAGQQRTFTVDAHPSWWMSSWVCAGDRLLGVGSGGLDVVVYSCPPPSLAVQDCHPTPVLTYAPPGYFAPQDSSSVNVPVDLDGDTGLDLVITWAQSDGVTPPRVGVYDLTAEGPQSADQFIAEVVAEGQEYLWDASVPIGDYNGDGVGDLCVINRTRDQVGLFYGPLSGSVAFADADALISASPELELSGFGKCGSIGDLDGDGRDDFAIGASDTEPGGSEVAFGGVLAFTAPPSGAVAAAEAPIVFRIDRPDFMTQTYNFYPVGDLDGDGFDDVVYSGWGFPDALGVIHDPVKPQPRGVVPQC